MAVSAAPDTAARQQSDRRPAYTSRDDSEPRQSRSYHDDVGRRSTVLRAAGLISINYDEKLFLVEDRRQTDLVTTPTHT